MRPVRDVIARVLGGKVLGHQVARLGMLRADYWCPCGSIHMRAFSRPRKEHIYVYVYVYVCVSVCVSVVGVYLCVDIYIKVRKRKSLEPISCISCIHL